MNIERLVPRMVFDIRTVLFSFLVIHFVNTLVVAVIWLRNRSRFEGTFLWMLNYAFQSLALVLLLLNRKIPDWLSIGISTSLIIVGSFLMVLGMERFLGCKIRRIFLSAPTAMFLLMNFWFAVVQPNLAYRTLSISAALLVISIQCMWLIFFKAGTQMRVIARGIGAVCAGIGLLNVVNIVGFFFGTDSSNDFLQPDKLEAYVLFGYEVLSILLTYSFALMCNSRLLSGIEEEEGKFSIIFNSSLYAIILTRLSDTQILEVNKGFEAMTGYPTADAIGKTTADLRFWQNEEDKQEVYRELLAHGSVHNKECSFRHRSGRPIVGIYTGEVVTVGNERCVLSSISDITDRKRAEDLRRQSEERFRKIYEDGPLGMAISDANFHFIMANNTLCRMLGYSEPELKGLTFRDITHPDHVTSDAQNVQKLVRGEIPVYKTEKRYVRKDGRQLWGALTLTANFTDDGSFMYSVAMIEDISERKKAEEELRHEQNLLTILMDNLPDHIYFKDRESRFIRMNRSHAKRFGLNDPAEAIGKTDFDFFSEPHAQGAFDDEQRIIRTGRSLIGIEEKETWPDGHVTWVSTTKMPMRNAKNEIIGTFGISRNITEQKQAEKELLLRNTALESAANAIMIADKGGILIFVNDAFCRLTGYTRAEAVGRNPNFLKSGLHTDSFYQKLWKTILSGEVWKGEIVNRRKDSSLYTAEMTITPVRGEQGDILHFIAINQDITEQKKLQGELLQAQKNQSIGTLAGGIAHDFNNILAIILGYASTLEATATDDMVRKCSRVIIQAVNRGSALVRQILTFARKSDINMDSMNFSDLLDELISMLRETFPRVITIVDVIEKEIPPITADRAQIHQALLNLCVNARDAMPDGGTITISASAQSKAMVRKKFPSAENDQFLCISVEDTGIGMDETARTRIFDPFYTTKEPGKGTGLGLAVVYGVVKSHHGFIDVESAIGRGSTFRLYFPLTPSGESISSAAPPGELYSAGGTETVLLVEDEEDLREMLRELLEHKGYSVFPAFDGTEALSIYTRHPKEIDIVLTDLGMPGMTGIEMLKKFKKINAGLPVVFASGFFDPEKKSRLQTAGAAGFLQKPYRTDEVLKMLREVLDADRCPA